MLSRPADRRQRRGAGRARDGGRARMPPCASTASPSGSATASRSTTPGSRSRRGEFMTLLGPSGCGKTTLLNLVAGFLAPDQGEIFIDGALVTDVPTFEREIGIVFQNYALFPHMTVANNVAYGLKARGVAQGRDQAARRPRRWR